MVTPIGAVENRDARSAKVAVLKQGNACEAVRDYVHHFANPVRLKILCELAGGERTVNELAEAIGARQPTVSQQLNHLRLSGLVDRTRQGSKRLYRITDPLANEMMDFLLELADKLAVRSGALGAPECV